MKAVESEGSSVQEAIDRALLLLGLSADEVEVSVIRDPGVNGVGETAVVRVQPKSAADATMSPADDEAFHGEADTRPLRTPGRSKKKAESADELADEDDTENDDGGVSGETHGRTRRAHKVHDDEEEVPLTDEEGERADRAGDFLEDLFEKLDVDCYVEVAADRVQGRIWIDIAGPDTGLIIGRKGAMLDAIELILNRAMDNADGGGLRIGLDAEGYRERRTEKLRSVAEQQAIRAARAGRPVPLEPMSARDRRIVHMALRGDHSVRTESEGEGPERHVVIKPLDK